MSLDEEQKALVALGQWLRAQGYRFTTVTPLTHGRVVGRHTEARDLRDIFGWSLPFGAGMLPDEAQTLLARAGALVALPGGFFRSAVRFSSLGDLLFVHSAYPTGEADAVFFGPDTYRYARVLREVARTRTFRRAVDVGAGSGAGLLSVSARCGEVHLADINPRALRWARVNAELAGASDRVRLAHSDVLANVEGEFDLVAANPPFLVDDAERAYRHGGDRGIALSVRIATTALTRLAPGGVLALYTCTPVVEGRHLLQDALAPALASFVQTFAGTVTWDEVDVDVFGEELERPAYADVERLAIVSLVASRG